MLKYKTAPLIGLLATLGLSGCSSLSGYNGLALQGALDKEVIQHNKGELLDKVALEQMQIRSTDQAYLQALISLKNHVDQALPVTYTIEWLDAQENILERNTTKWHPFILGAKERQVILTTAPNTQAVAYRFKLKPDPSTVQ